MRNHFNSFARAVSFLTVIPMPPSSIETVNAEDFARSFGFFPLVGLLIGFFCSLFYFLSHRWMPNLLAAVCITALLTLLTRGLHLDGLADLTDGVGGGYTAERRLQIMKDSRIGAFGSLALTLAILFKVSALHALMEANHWQPILLVPVFSRLSMVLTAYKSPYARAEGGLAKSFVEPMTLQQPLTALLFSGAAAVVASPPWILAYLAGAVCCSFSIRALSCKWLGGVTGDVLGAANEVAEITLLSLFACATRINW